MTRKALVKDIVDSICDTVDLDIPENCYLEVIEELKQVVEKRLDDYVIVRGNLVE